MTLNFLPVLASWPLLLQGLGLTVLLTLIAAVVGMVVGIAAGWIRAQGPWLLRLVAGIYVEVIRNTPFIVQLFFVFFGLPALGVKFSANVASIIAMVLNLGAYASEIVRAGLEATPQGQIEAAQSLAMSRWQIFLRVVLPPSLARVWPALVSQIIIVMLGSAVCSQISTEELSFNVNLISDRSFRNFEAYIVATLMYLAVAVVVRKLLNWAGPRFVFGGRRGSP